MAHKILFTGTLDAGKTTLLREFSSDSRVSIVREVSQDLINIHGYMSTQNPEFQDWFLKEQLDREILAEKSRTRFIICDRGTVDMVAFSKIIGHEIKNEWVESMLNRYDCIALFDKNDINFKPEIYDVPFDIRLYREAVDQAIREVVSSLGVFTIEVKGTHHERLAIINDYMDSISLKEGNQKSNKEGRYWGERNERR